MCYAYIQYLSEAYGVLFGFLKSCVLKLVLKQAYVGADIVEQLILKVHSRNTKLCKSVSLETQFTLLSLPAAAWQPSSLLISNVHTVFALSGDPTS